MTRSLIKLKAYISLSRISKPTGIFLLWIPCLWGICAYESHPLLILKKALLFLLGAVSLRTCGCIINDIFDRKFDKHVERTKNRPLANGSLTVREALIFLFICLIPGFYVFITLSQLAKLISLIGLILAIFYPLCKRFTYFPQVVLGLTFNIGIWVAGIDYASHSALFLLYCAGIFWTLAYDTIYAFQDIEDDAIIGVKSTALFFKNHPKSVITTFYTIMFIFLLCYNVFFEKSNLSIPVPNFLLTLGVYSYVLWLIYNWNPKSSSSCHKFFKRNIGVGLGVM
jgi:4-hydroxybenzoate polyprenyltransferase